MYRIKEVLQEKGWKSKDLAEALGKSKQQISNILTGNGNVSMAMLSEIANVLGVPVWQLLVSPKEIVEQDENTITCPKCGTKIEFRAKTD